MVDLEEDVERLQALIEAQAHDHGLWFVAQTAAEAYLQQELRVLHQAVEAIDVEAAVRKEAG